MADTADLQSQQQAQLKQENYQSEEEEENTNNADEEEDPVDDLTESAWILKLRGLPWSVTTQDILNFLDGVEVVGGTNGVHLITFSLNSTRPNGEAFVVCANEESFNKAFEYNKHTIGHRYIEIFSSSFEDFQNIMHKQTIDQQDTVVKLRGLPWRVTEQEIADFFQGMELSDEYGIHIHMDRSGRASGEAFVQFKTAESCEKALKRNLEKIGHRYIEIFRSTTSEIRRSMQQSNDNNYNNGGGGGNNNNGGGNTNYGGGNNNRATPYDRNNRGDRGSGFNRMGGNNNMGNNNGGGNGMGYNNRGNNMRGVGERSYSSTGSNNSWNNDGNNGGNNGGNNFGNNSYGGGGNNNGGGFNNFGNNGGMNGGNNGGFNPGGFGGNNFGNSGGGFGNNFSGGFMGGNSNQSPLNFGFGSGGNGNMGSSNSVLSGVGSGFGGGNNYGTGNNGGNNSLGGGGNNGSGSGSGYGAMNMLGFGGIGGGGVGTPAFSSPNSTGIQFGQNNSGGNNNARNNYGSGYSSNSNGATSNNLQQQSGSMPPVNNTAGNVGNNMSGPSSNSGNEQFCVHLRGMPYYCDEMDIIKFFAPLKPVNCKVIYNNKNMHSGGGNAYFATHADAMEAMKHDKEKMGSRYIELFYDTPNRQNNRRY